MAESKVTYKELKNATVHVDNSVDASKTYDISADVNITGTNVDSFDAGEVMKGGNSVANFSCFSENNLNVGFQNVDSENQCAVLEAINDFMTNVKQKVSTSNPVTFAL